MGITETYNEIIEEKIRKDVLNSEIVRANRRPLIDGKFVALAGVVLSIAGLFLSQLSVSIGILSIIYLLVDAWVGYQIKIKEIAILPHEKINVFETEGNVHDAD